MGPLIDNQAGRLKNNYQRLAGNAPKFSKHTDGIQAEGKTLNGLLQKTGGEPGKVRQLLQAATERVHGGAVADWLGQRNAGEVAQNRFQAFA